MEKINETGYLVSNPGAGANQIFAEAFLIEDGVTVRIEVKEYPTSHKETRCESIEFPLETLKKYQGKPLIHNYESVEDIHFWCRNERLFLTAGWVSIMSGKNCWKNNW